MLNFNRGTYFPNKMESFWDFSDSYNSDCHSDINSDCDSDINSDRVTKHTKY